MKVYLWKRCIYIKYLFQFIATTFRKNQKLSSFLHQSTSKTNAWSTSLLQITWASSRTCHFTNKTISGNPKKLTRLLPRYISQKHFRVLRTPHFADINLSKFLSINWKTDLPKFLLIWYLGTLKLVGHKYRPYSLIWVHFTCSSSRQVLWPLWELI